MENQELKVPNIEPHKPEVDAKGNRIFKTAPDEINEDYVVPEEESGIIGSGSDQMGAEEFEDLMKS